MRHELFMHVGCCHLNARLCICQFVLCVLCIHLGAPIHPCGMVMTRRDGQERERKKKKVEETKEEEERKEQKQMKKKEEEDGEEEE